MKSPRARAWPAAKVVTSLVVDGQLFGKLCAISAQAVACEIDTVGVVDEAVEDGAGVSWITDVPSAQVYPTHGMSGMPRSPPTTRQSRILTQPGS
jgi:hypothetical protein